MTMSEVRSAAETSVVQLHKPFSLHADNVFEGGVDRDGQHEKPMWFLQGFIDQSPLRISALN